MPAAANRDPQVFERSGEFDIARKPKLHLGFGFGMHQCLGMNIARKEVLTMVTHLLDDLPPLQIIECDYGLSWALWGPAKLVVRAA
jgi:cytochrome P450